MRTLIVSISLLALAPQDYHARGWMDPPDPAPVPSAPPAARGGWMGFERKPLPASFRHELPKPEPALPDPEPEKPEAPEMPPPADPTRDDVARLQTRVDSLSESVSRLTERLARLESDHAKFMVGPPPPSKSPPAAVSPPAPAPVAAPRPVQYVQPPPPVVAPTYQPPVYQPPAAWSYPVQGATCQPGQACGFAPFGFRLFRR
jgi:hypothetical protein